MPCLSGASSPRLQGVAARAPARGKTPVRRALLIVVLLATSTLAGVKTAVDTYSSLYGELDGENNYHYAATFHRLYNNIGGSYITSAQKSALASLRKKYMTVTHPDGTTVDYSSQNTYYLYAAEVPESSSLLVSYTGDAFTDPFFKRY